MSTKNFLSKKVIIVVAILAVGALSVVLVVPSIAQATAQREQQKMMMSWSGQEMPKINGSVSVVNETMKFIKENVKVPFTSAAQTAQGQVRNGTVLGGHIGVLQGYLVYIFLVGGQDISSRPMGHLVVVDAGNGNVLYTSPEGQVPFGIFGHSMTFGPTTGHGSEDWNGPGRMNGLGWRIWH
jgi:hypothetical protein